MQLISLRFILSRSLRLAEAFRSLFDQNASQIRTSGDEGTPRIHAAGQPILHSCIEAFRVDRMGGKSSMAVMLEDGDVTWLELRRS